MKETQEMVQPQILHSLQAKPHSELVSVLLWQQQKATLEALKM